LLWCCVKIAPYFFAVKQQASAFYPVKGFVDAKPEVRGELQPSPATYDAAHLTLVAR
jgi:hypothetical protein